MHHDVVDKEVRQVNADSDCGKQQEQQQRDDVWRIEPANSSFPESAETNVWLKAGGSGPGPLQVNAEAGDDEEQKDADVTK